MFTSLTIIFVFHATSPLQITQAYLWRYIETWLQNIWKNNDYSSHITNQGVNLGMGIKPHQTQATPMYNYLTLHTNSIQSIDQIYFGTVTKKSGRNYTN